MNTIIMFVILRCLYHTNLVNTFALFKYMNTNTTTVFAVSYTVIMFALLPTQL